MRKYLVSLSLLLAGSSFGGSLSDIIGSGGTVGNWLGDAIYKVQAPTSVDVQGSRYYYGGGFSLRTPRRTYQLFNVQPPRLSMGCGGIDMTFGAFGYLRPEYLVEFGKNVLENAPAFAFKTALEVFCPTCEDIMTKLENLANLLNSMQLDSCAFAQAASNYVKDKLQSGNASKDAEGGKTEFYLNKLETMSKRAKDVLDKFVASGLERSEVVRKIKDLGEGEWSMVNDVMPQLKSGSTYKLGGSPLLDDANFRKAMRNLFGDVHVTIPSGDNGEIVVAPIPPCVKGEGVATAVQNLALTGSATLCGEDVEITLGGKSIYTAVKEFTDEIVDRVETRQPLDPIHLEFLAMYPFPAYRMINTLSVYPSVLRMFADNLAQYFAYELVKLLVLEHIRAYTHSLVALRNSDLLNGNESAQRSLDYAISAASNENLLVMMESIRVAQRGIETGIKGGLEMVKAYEQETAKLLGADPAYQSVIWSQVSGIRAK